MDKPLFILLGAARSGTTLLARSLLSRVNGVVYWGEPNHVWMHGHAYRRHDALSTEDLSPRLKDYLQKRFEERLAQGGRGHCLLEKTPANCLRVPYIRAAFPQARFIHLLRHGGDVTRSAAKEWKGEGKDALDSAELRQGSGLTRVGKGMRAYLKLRERVYDARDILELPAYLPRFANFALRNLNKGKDRLWGPRFPGIRDFRRKHSLYETCAEQWRWQVQSVLSTTQDIDSHACYTMRFEDLMTHPAEQLGRLLDWMKLSMPDTDFQELVKRIQARPWRASTAKDRSPDEEKALARIQPLQQQLGYLEQ